jgi:hypothetical protein
MKFDFFMTQFRRYLITITCLLGFFVVIIYKETSGQRNVAKPPDAQTSPPTPCPSYKNFAPPNYGSVMKKLKNQKAYIVPVHEGDNNPFQNAQTSTTVVVNVEVDKNDSR